MPIISKVNRRLKLFAFKNLVLTTNMVSKEKCTKKVLVAAHPHAGNDMIRNVVHFHTNGKRLALSNRPKDMDGNRIPLTVEFLLENDKRTGIGDVICYHLPCEGGELNDFFLNKNYAVISYFRDPRDIFCSKLNRVLREKTHPYHNELSSLKTHEERFLCLIQNFMNKTGTPSLFEIYSSYFKWNDLPGVLTVKYEDLMGRFGPKSLSINEAKNKDEIQDKLLQKIGKHLGLSNSLLRRKSVSRMIEITARRGRVGNFRESFSDKDHEMFFEHFPKKFLDKFSYS